LVVSERIGEYHSQSVYRLLPSYSLTGDIHVCFLDHSEVILMNALSPLMQWIEVMQKREGAKIDLGIELLKKMGLSDLEDRCYLALLEEPDLPKTGILQMLKSVALPFTISKIMAA